MYCLICKVAESECVAEPGLLVAKSICTSCGASLDYIPKLLAVRHDHRYSGPSKCWQKLGKPVPDTAH